MAEEINRQRRRFIRVAALTVAAAPLGVNGSARALSLTLPATHLSNCDRRRFT